MLPFVLPGMELFEEALQKWEQALTVRQKDPISSSVTCDNTKEVTWDDSKEEDLLPVELLEVCTNGLYSWQGNI